MQACMLLCFSYPLWYTNRCQVNPLSSFHRKSPEHTPSLTHIHTHMLTLKKGNTQKHTSTHLFSRYQLGHTEMCSNTGTVGQIQSLTLAQSVKLL